MQTISTMCPDGDRSQFPAAQFPDDIAFAAQQQVAPINWGRAIWSGILAAALMLLFVDACNMFGLTSFSYEQYVGSLIRGTLAEPRNWIFGFIAHCVIGAGFGLLYAYCFERIFRKARVVSGTYLGVVHTILAAFVLFPIFNAIHLLAGLLPPSGYGLLGAALGWGTPVILFLGHLLFGSVMGACYGPVRLERLHALYFEPGDSSVAIEMPEITDEDDPRDPENRMVI